MRTSLALGLTALAVSVNVVAVSTVDAGAAIACNTTLATGGDWPSFGHDLANTRRQPAETGISTLNVRKIVKRWVFTPNDGGPAALNSTPTEAGGCVFVGSSKGWVYALDVNTGAVQWKTQLPVTAAGLGGQIVSAVTITGGRAIVLMNQLADGSGNGPYAAALDSHTGAVLWTSPVFETHAGSYTNASAQVANGVVIAGWSPAESDPTGTGGVVLLDVATGALLRRVYTIPLADQAQGYAGGGIWLNAAVDAAGYAYAGTGNPFSKTKQHINTNAIIKIDVNKNRATFGQVVGSYPGNIDQYTKQLQFLADTPVCAETASLFDTSPFDDPVCGQLDLDFGASPNLFTVNGQQVVGELQKAGVYHAAYTSTMTKKWAQIVGTPCAFCNAAATATFNGKIYGEGTLGGIAVKLDQATGVRGAFSVVADAIHYQGFSIANGVVYTIDSLGFLDAFNAANGAVLMRKPLLPDAGQLVLSLSSSGVAIARNHVLVSAGSFDFGATASTPQGGYLIAYTK